MVGGGGRGHLLNPDEKGWEEQRTANDDGGTEYTTRESVSKKLVPTT